MRLAQSLLLSCLAGIAACKAPQPELAPFPEKPRPPMVEEDLKPSGRAEVAILDLNEDISADEKKVIVTGTLLNRGTRATHRIIVHVQALDTNGQVLAETQGYANPEDIAPGNTGKFSVELTRMAATQDYHVEVLYKP